MPLEWTRHAQENHGESARMIDRRAVFGEHGNETA
jgi:hypothetical protein